MPLIFPTPFPNEVTKDPIEVWRAARALWSRAQKFLAGQVTYSATIPATTVRAVTFVSGTDAGVDSNLVVGMQVAVAPPASISAQLQCDAYCPATGQLTIRIRNETSGGIAVAGTWSYVGYTF